PRLLDALPSSTTCGATTSIGTGPSSPSSACAGSAGAINEERISRSSFREGLAIRGPSRNHPTRTVVGCQLPRPGPTRWRGRPDPDPWEPPRLVAKPRSSPYGFLESSDSGFRPRQRRGPRHVV